MLNTEAGMTMERLLNAEEATAFLVEVGYRITAKRLYSMSGEGKLPSIKDGKYRYWRRSDLVAWLTARLSKKGE